MTIVKAVDGDSGGILAEHGGEEGCRTDVATVLTAARISQTSTDAGRLQEEGAKVEWRAKEKILEAPNRLQAQGDKKNGEHRVQCYSRTQIALLEIQDEGPRGEIEDNTPVEFESTIG